jgi:hypothetical protein
VAYECVAATAVKSATAVTAAAAADTVGEARRRKSKSENARKNKKGFHLETPV